MPSDDVVLGLENTRENWTLAWELADGVAFERTDGGTTYPHVIVIKHLTDGWFAALFEEVHGARPAPMPIEVHKGLPTSAARTMLERLQLASETISPPVLDYPNEAE